MIRFAGMVFSVGLLVGALSGCGPSDDGVYTAEVLPILEEKCADCHLRGMKRGSLTLDSHKDVLKGGKSGKVVVPGDAESSLLYQALHEDSPVGKMPKKGTPLTEDEIDVLRAWIDGGAH